MSDQQVVLAVFDDEAAADAAVEALRAWDEASDDIKLHAIGVLVLDADGKVKAHKLGQRSVGAGAGIGMMLALITPPGLVAGAAVGGIAGALHHKGLGLTEAERAALGEALQGGKAAVGVQARREEGPAVGAKLGELGGTVQVLDVSAEDRAQADEIAASPSVFQLGAPPQFGIT